MSNIREIHNPYMIRDSSNHLKKQNKSRRAGATKFPFCHDTLLNCKFILHNVLYLTLFYGIVTCSACYKHLTVNVTEMCIA
jgi:hypothetical protein